MTSLKHGSGGWELGINLVGEWVVGRVNYELYINLFSGILDPKPLVPVTAGTSAYQAVCLYKCIRFILGPLLLELRIPPQASDNVALSFDDDGNLDTQKVGVGHVAANTVRFLIAGSQAGGLIGVYGQNIETLRNSSGATITVLAQYQLPLCASAHESDRVVQVLYFLMYRLYGVSPSLMKLFYLERNSLKLLGSFGISSVAGDIPAVLRAVVEIGCQLRDNPPKQVISISPTYNLGYSRLPQPYVDPSSESGATIKVHGGKGEQKQRQVHLGGSAQQETLVSSSSRASMPSSYVVRPLLPP
ncbi:hypothetical protein HAX54_036356 [Datura stramonium]|uniref:K Homology domain-containing protein n=1 Tax=Datura stramonium TaxID=4076 RepID=A0ABS8VKP6_DATST|nr:hypothetical protein [Datura stramonium]